MSAVNSGRTPDVPTVAETVWALFWALDRRRQGTGYGVNPITHQEIEAAARLYGVRLRRWHLGALDKMERVRVDWLNRDKKDERTVSDQPMTVDRFRSMFGVKGTA